MNNRGTLILLVMLAFLSVYASGCGGRGDKGATITIVEGNSGWVSIGDTSSPAPVTVNRSPITLTGQSFISPSVSWYDESHGVSGVEVTWRNDTTGASGSTNTYVECGWFIIPLCVNNWGAYVPLSVGENHVVIAAADTAGNSASASITVTYVP